MTEELSRTEYFDSPRYRRMRKAQLLTNPLCKLCEAKGVITAATEVDHITPRHKGGAIFDFANMQSLCHECHKEKTRAENSTSPRRTGACIHGTPSHLHCGECDAQK